MDDCVFVTDECVVVACGNGFVESGEQCDGTALNGQSCLPHGSRAHPAVSVLQSAVQASWPKSKAWA